MLNDFDGVCYLCQKNGHKVHFYPSTHSGENAGGNVNNDNGGKMYQFTRDCEDGMDPNEKVQSEMMLVNLSFLCCTMFLNDPNMWLATVPTTLHCAGLIATKGATVGDSFTVGNSLRDAAPVVGIISCMLCDQYRMEIGPCKLWEVSHLLDKKFNLFSVFAVAK